MTTVSETKLLPCPFCGGEAEVLRCGTDRVSMQYGCTECGCFLETGEMGNPGVRWNTRAALTAALADRVVVPSGWQPIETAPKDGTVFLAAQAGSSSSNDTPWWVLFWNDDALECVSSGRPIPTATEIVGGATHWQPLPAPPPASAGTPR